MIRCMLQMKQKIRNNVTCEPIAKVKTWNVRPKMHKRSLIDVIMLFCNFAILQTGLQFCIFVSLSRLLTKFNRISLLLGSKPIDDWALVIHHFQQWLIEVDILIWGIFCFMALWQVYHWMNKMTGNCMSHNNINHAKTASIFFYWAI